MENLYMVLKKEFVRNEEGQMKLVADLITDEAVTKYFAKKIADLEKGRTIMTVKMFNREIKSGYMKLV